MKRALFCALLVLESCATSNALKTTAVSERNIDNLARLNLGMSQAQVLGIMRDPYDNEVFQLEEDKYDVFFYVTNPTVLGQTRMVPFNLTPLIFRNKILIGTGYAYYHWLKSKTLEKPAEVSMSCFRKEIADESSSSESTEPPPPSPNKKKEIEVDEEDEEMIQDEGDQNFNFW